MYDTSGVVVLGLLNRLAQSPVYPVIPFARILYNWYIAVNALLKCRQVHIALMRIRRVPIRVTLYALKTISYVAICSHKCLNYYVNYTSIMCIENLK